VGGDQHYFDFSRAETRKKYFVSVAEGRVQRRRRRPGHREDLVGAGGEKEKYSLNFKNSFYEIVADDAREESLEEAALYGEKAFP